VSAVKFPIPITIVMSSFEPGGTERQMIELVRRLDRTRWDVSVATLRESGAWLDRVKDSAPVTLFPVPSFKRPAVLNALRGFAQWCRDKRIAVVQTVDLPSNIFGLFGAAMGGVRLRLGSRRELVLGRSVTELALQRAAYGVAHVVVANAGAAADRLRRERVPKRKVCTVANGLDLSSYRPRSPRSSIRRVLVVANLRPEKGHDVLIDAVPEVLRSYPDARFEIVGGGPEHPRLVARAQSRGVLHAFDFAGHSDNIPARLDSADLFVLPSRSEAFPNALLEAMAAGLPTVASAVGGILELVEPERTGVLVPAEHPEALAAAICRVMENPDFAARMGAAARARVQADYSFDRMVAGFENLYLARLASQGGLAAEPLFTEHCRKEVAR
jgi:glycosyltransferase involved in cell wall biosynthesis